MCRVFIRKFYWLFLAIAVIALSPIVSSHAYGAVKFSDYFTDGDDAGWTQLNRNWSLTLGRYVLDRDYKPDHTENGTFYRIAVWAIGSGDSRSGGGILPDGLVQIFKYVKGSVVSSTEKESSNTAIGTNAIIIEVDGENIKITINGKKILNWKDDNKPILYGGIGLGAIWEAEAWFDNVIVRHRVKIT